MDKPAGPTSHDIVDRVRRALRLRRVGHTGTLDPFATGVLPVCVGKATRLARFLSEGDKVYQARLRLGFATTTDDLLGEPLGAPDPAPVGFEDVQRVCRSLTGAIDQVPPHYSAKRVGGRRAYDRARRGQDVALAPCRVHVHALDVLTLEGEHLEIEVRCSPGTYVRALARDIGRALGVGAHLTALRRTRSGEFDLRAAVPGDALSPDVRASLLPLSQLLRGLPALRLRPEGVAAVRHGRAVDGAGVVGGLAEPPSGRVRLLDEAGDRLLALAQVREFGGQAGRLSPHRVLQPDVVLAE